MAANVDMSGVLDELEAVLLAGVDAERCQAAIEVLRRWQWDGDLDEASRRRAGLLVREFAWRYAA